MGHGVLLVLSISTDATAGVDISSRRTIGRVKHLATLFRWVQDYVTSGEIKFKKVHTSVKVSDILTKAVPSRTILKKMMELMSFKVVTAKAGLALTA